MDIKDRKYLEDTFIMRNADADGYDRHDFSELVDVKVITPESVSEYFGESELRNSKHRYIDCEMAMNTPKIGRKTLMRLDTEEMVWEKEMTPSEMQLKLDLSNEDNLDDALAKHSKADDNNE